LGSKSGSNAFHGSAYEYLRNTVFDANNFFNNASGVPRSQLVQNQFGVTIGGPIVKNRSFFFFNYERLTRQIGIPFQGRTPTPAELSGDFRADPPIYDPKTRQQFACNGVLNVICPNRIDPTANVMANVLHYWPVPNANLAAPPAAPDSGPRWRNRSALRTPLRRGAEVVAATDAAIADSITAGPMARK
jgi:hypothetical protein